MYLVIDLGGTNIRGTWMDHDGAHGTIQHASRPRTLEGTKAHFKDLVDRLRETAPRQVLGVGLATAGPLDHRAQKYLQTSNMPELNGFAIGDFVRREIGLPFLMENDAQAAALGEVWKGGIAGATNAVVLTLGTGVGSGVILEGRLWRGGHFTGPELGHVFLGPGRSRACGCGQVGCIETWLNKWAFERLASRCGLSQTQPRYVAQLWEQGDPAATACVRRYGHRIGLAISTLQVVFGAEAIGLSGGLSTFFQACEPYVWRTLRHRFTNRQWWLPATIAASPDPDMSGLWGMAKAWLDNG